MMPFTRINLLLVSFQAMNYRSWIPTTFVVGLLHYLTWHVVAVRSSRFELGSSLRIEWAQNLPTECGRHDGHQTNNSDSSSNSSRYDPLACWLKYLTVHIPDQSFQSGWIEMSIQDLQCSNLTVGGLDSTYQPSISSDNNDSDPVMAMSWNNLSATCTGSYHSTGFSGKILATASGPQGALQWSLAISSSDNNTSQNDTWATQKVKRPVTAHTISCRSLFQVDSLHFSGSISAKLIDLFRKSITGYVTDALQQQLCPLMSNTVDPILTHYIGQLNHFLDPYLPTQNDTFSPSAASRNVGDNLKWLPTARRHLVSQMPTWVDFSRDTPFLTGSLHSLNQFISHYLQEGFLKHWLRPLSNDAGRHDETKCHFLFDGVNGVLRSLLFSETGHWDVPLPPRLHRLHFVLPRYGAVALNVRNLTWTGLDQWDRLVLLQPHAEQEFETILKTSAEVGLIAQMTVHVTSIPDGMFQGDPLDEDFQIRVRLSDLQARADLHVLMSHADLDQVTLAPLIGVLAGWIAHNISSQDLSCLLKPLFQVEASELSAQMRLAEISFRPLDPTSGNKDVPEWRDGTIAGQLEQDLDALLNNLFQLVLQEYEGLVTASLKGLVAGPVREAMNQFLANVTSPPESCPTMDNRTAPSKQPHQANFTNLQPLNGLNQFLSRNSTLGRINQYLDCTTDYLSSALFLRISDALPSGFLQIGEFKLAQVGRLNFLELLSPQGDGMHLKSAMEYGVDNTTIIESIEQPTFLASMAWEDSTLNISGTLNLTLTIGDIKSSGLMAILYDSDRLRALDLLQVLAHGHCLAVPIDEFDIHGIESMLGNFDLKVVATMTGLGPSAIELIWNSTDHPSLQAIPSEIFSWVVDSFREAIRVSVASAMATSQRSCEVQGDDQSRSGAEGDNHDQHVLSILLIVGLMFLFAQPGVLLIQRAAEQAELEELEGRHLAGELMQPLIPPHEQFFDAAMDDIQSTSVPLEKESLLESPRIPVVVRLVVPMLLIGTMALLLSSNLSVGATVDLVVSTTSQAIAIPSLFEFSLYNTAKEMLLSQIYPLFLLVVIFSGIWPYTKLLLMLYGWIVPKSALSATERGRLLLALDALGKFSLVDTYVLILMMVAFRYHLESGDQDLMVDVYVSPQFGFFGFLIATCASMLLGHIMVFFHRRSELPDLSLEADAIPDVEGQPLSDVESVLQHAFRVDDSCLTLSNAFRFLVICIWLAIVPLLAIGIRQKCFVFEFGGLAGLARGEEGRHSSYSLLSLGSSLARSVRSDEYSWGIVFLQSVYYFYSVVTPFATTALLMLLLITPLTMKQQLFILAAAEIANAWSALEVFCLSIVAALLEISTFATFLVGHRCDLLESVFRDYIEDHPDLQTCFTVRASVDRSAAFLLLAGVLQSAWVSMVLRLVHLAVQERIDSHIQQRPARKSEPSTVAPGLDEEKGSRSWIQWSAECRCTSWILCSSSSRSGRRPTEEEEAALVSTPGERQDSGDDDHVQDDSSSPLLADEWKDAAERDPAWKEWKETTNVT